MIPYVNIHTHHDSSPGNVAIRNIFAGEKEPVADTAAYFSMGLHPWHLTSTHPTDTVLESIKAAMNNHRCLAVGEAGLDKICKSPWHLQTDAFLKQAHLAQEYQKPLIIHCVKAYSELLAIRKQISATITWIFHGFHSSKEMAIQLLESGCVLSFGKSLMSDNDKIKKLFISLPDDAFFLETDDEPIAIEQVYEHAARIKNISVEDLQKQQCQNFNALFKIKDRRSTSEA
jgi:TatD DNase family protein